jgi:DNA-3-methyladenine glycosylase
MVNGILIQAMNHDFLYNPAEQVAPQLLGSLLRRELNGNIITVRIVEVEAYDQTDVASHSYNGETLRTKVMFGEAGHLYVYFTYGMHFCCNIVVGNIGYGSAVLIRAVEPIDGLEFMQKNRDKVGIEISNGPAKLCQALAIDTSLNGHNLQKKPLRLYANKPLHKNKITQTTRIGISKGLAMPWRYYITANPYVSRT